MHWHVHIATPDSVSGFVCSPAVEADTPEAAQSKVRRLMPAEGYRTPGETLLCQPSQSPSFTLLVNRDHALLLQLTNR